MKRAQLFLTRAEKDTSNVCYNLFMLTNTYRKGKFILLTFLLLFVDMDDVIYL